MVEIPCTLRHYGVVDHDIDDIYLRTKQPLPVDASAQIAIYDHEL